MKWIKCSDEMPEINNSILYVHEDGTKYHGYLTNDMGLPLRFNQEVECSISCCYGPKSFEPHEISHWMSLPENPKD